MVREKGFIQARSNPVSFKRLIISILMAALLTSGLVAPLAQNKLTYAAQTYQHYGWGDNLYGQLGTGNNTSGNTPAPLVLPAGVNNFVKFSTGALHTLGIGDNGKVYAWGRNLFGQLGDGTTIYRNAPVEVQMPTGVKGLLVAAGGYEFSVAYGDNNKLYAWGRGQAALGNGTGNDQLTPGPVLFDVPAGVTITALEAGGTHVLALASDGKIYSWGDGFLGALGDGTNNTRFTPVQVKFPAGVTAFKAIAAGGNHSLALGNNDQLYAWGWNFYGQLGTGFVGNVQVDPLPVQLPAGVKATKIFGAGAASSILLGSDNNLYTWGNNSSGMLATGDTVDKNLPVKVNLPTGAAPVIKAKMGQATSVILTGDGMIYSAGANNSGIFANPDVWGSTAFVAAKFPATIKAINDIQVGSNYILGTVVLKQDQTITFNSLADKTYGDTTFNLTATASSGLAVSYISSTPAVCTVSGAVVTLKAVGICSITASQSGNDNFNPASDVTRSFNVGKANLTIKANDRSIVYNSPIPTDFAATYSGFVNGDTATSLTGILVCNTTAVLGSNAGQYPINCGGQNSGNYTISYQAGTLSITKAESSTGLTVSASQVQPGQSLSLTASISSVAGGKPSGAVSFFDGVDMLGSANLDANGKATLSISLSGLGSHSLSAKYSGDTNYTGSNSQSQTVTVIAPPAPSGYPIFDYSILSFKNLALNNGGSTIDGKIAVGGNASITSYNIATKMAGGQNNVLVNGNLSLNGGTVKGNALYGGTFSQTGTLFTQGKAIKQANAFDATAAEAYAVSLSQALKNQGGKLVAPQYGGFNLNAGAGVNYFRVKGSDLANANNLVINAPAGATVIVNIDGAIDRMQYMGFSLNAGITRENVLLNFADATSLSINGVRVQGTILAPGAAVNFVNGELYGNLIAQSFSGGSTLFNYASFTGTLPQL